ncbi:DNA-3-methyladenine glycosylase I [Actinopolyspora erythraea]|uniref:3-methyladenine DNA glycosylase n=1 Tax=Actinopolyspora erythraea TaxID=414996 RepID=A0A099D073_9ACTN|nr:DNA-3-methyladenine glycosylase I [Actinopolyspora erythraea]ASU79782.1 DNA-3-methyladenine glycosylase I [Actinopolyspora erythraea]KGI79593.1 3-methyladenine DNA glycosylase [Actinopolyspora erythraea]
MSAITGDDGRKRCHWGAAPPDYREYHDTEWGKPVHGQRAMFERLCLESFQSGLSWLTILRKRPAFRVAFADFEPRRVAEFDEHDRQRLLADRGIVRNRAKIDAVVGNARAVLELERPLDELLWSFAPEPGARTRPGTSAEVPANTPESSAMSARLRGHGFRFVGPTTCYALMQATGMVDDHVAECWLAG